MNKQDLLNTYKHKIELHAHSFPASPCCDCSIERALEIYAERQIEAICLTNHFYKDNRVFSGKTKNECIDVYLSDYERFKTLSKPYGIKILLGCEIRFNENANDYLIYGVDKEILQQSFDYLEYDLKTYRDNVPLENSLLIQAHPFRDNMVLADANLVDGVETLNFHNTHNNRNAACSMFAKENNISICTGGSDFHHDMKYHPASCIMLSKTIPVDSFELAKILKSGDYIFLLGNNHIIIP